MDITDNDIKKAISIAKNAKANAFTLHFSPKGACIITNDGKFFGGCNIETDISGLGVCAERCAVDQAIVSGRYSFKSIITFDGEFAHPCGVCLQYLMLFSQVSGQDIAIITAVSEEEYKKYSLKELMPIDYISDSNEEKLKSYRDKIIDSEVRA